MRESGTVARRPQRVHAARCKPRSSGASGGAANGAAGARHLRRREESRGVIWLFCGFFSSVRAPRARLGPPRDAPAVAGVADLATCELTATEAYGREHRPGNWRRSRAMCERAGVEPDPFLSAKGRMDPAPRVAVSIGIGERRNH